MIYSLQFSEISHKKLKKLHKFQLRIIDKKIKKILKDPYHFKPLKGDMYGARRVHIESSFVLVYEILESQKIVRILDYDHHEKVY